MKVSLTINGEMKNYTGYKIDGIKYILVLAKFVADEIVWWNSIFMLSKVKMQYCEVSIFS